MRLLVLGATGMLGHELVRVLSPRAETWATIRDARIPPEAAHLLEPARTCCGVEATDLEGVESALDRARPDVVLNAVGIIKQADAAKAPIPSIRVNALFPHELAARTAARGARLVHVSTDCVFSGRRGAYTEEDPPDPVDLYGRSKLLGEVTGPGALTLRTSIIGRELRGGLGLLAWLLAQEGGSVRGFSRAVFSGLTTTALAELVWLLITEHPELDGLWHASAAPIDKLALLELARDTLGLDVVIEPDDALVIDRSLDASRLRAATGWEAPPWPAMLDGLR